jgi:ABC-type cobalamin/Fe3+-siderophores transport system ATPase subunit
MIEIKNLSYKIKKTNILKNINLKIEDGDFWLIFGPNGAGKTTLLKILLGAITDYNGEIIIDNKNIKRNSKKEIAKKISYLPQFEEFSLPLCVKEILLSGRYPYTSFFKDYSKNDLTIFQNTVDQFELHEFVNRDINTLSGGERKKVMLASTFIQDVSIILFDEPFTFLDPEAISSLKKILTQLKNKGKTLIIVSHNIEILFPIVHKIVALKRGEIIYSGNKVFDKDIFKQTYNVNYEQLILKSREIVYLNE